MLYALVASLIAPSGITLSLPAASLKDALAEISKQTPAPIYVEGKLASEVVCLYLRDMPLKDLEKHIAKVSTGEWVERDGKKILTLPTWKDKQQAQDSFEERKQAIAQALAGRESPKELSRTELSRLVTQVEEATADMISSGNANYAEYEKARDRQYNLLLGAPTSRLLARMVQRFTATQLANLDPSVRICFSNTPNPVQRQFPFKTSDLLALFNREQSMLKQLLPAGQPMFSTQIEDRRRYTYAASPDCSELLMIVEPNRSSGLPTFKLYIGDSDLKVHSLVFTSLTRTNPKLTPETSLPEVEIPLTEQQQALCYALNFMRTPFLVDGIKNQPIRETIAPSLDWLSQPLKNEPLADLIGPTLISTATQAKKNLVALLPDSALSWTPRGDKVRSADLGVQIANRSGGYNSPTWDGLVENADKLITITPRMPWRWRDQRINRRALDRIFRTTFMQGTLSVLESALYINNCGTSTAFETGSYDVKASGFAEPMQGSFASSEKATWYHRDLLRLLGSMPEHVLRSFLNGGEATLSQLGKDKVERFLFGRDQIFNMFLDQTSHWWDRRFEDRRLSDEVWEKLPNGIPSSFKIVCQPSEETCIFIESGVTKGITINTPEEFGRDLDEMNLYYQEPTFKTGKAIKYNFQTVITPALTGRSELADVVLGKRTPSKRSPTFRTKCSGRSQPDCKRPGVGKPPTRNRPAASEFPRPRRETRKS